MSRTKADPPAVPIVDLCLPALAVVTPEILSRVSTAINAAGLAHRCDDVRIVLAEALNNVVEHAYRGGVPGAVAVRIALCGYDLCIDIADWGAPFSGNAIPSATPPEPQDLSEGGYGWFLIHALTSARRYTRRACCNHLHLRLAM